MAQLESRFQADWISWLTRLLDSTLASDASTQPSAGSSMFPVNTEEHLWQRLTDFIRTISQKQLDKGLSPELERFLREFGIDRNILVGMQKKEEREAYIITCIRKVHDEPVKATFSGRKSIQASQQVLSRPTKSNPAVAKKDAFDWFDVRSKYPYLKPKVKRVLVKSAYDSEDVSPCNEKLINQQPDFEDGWDE